MAEIRKNAKYYSTLRREGLDHLLRREKVAQEREARGKNPYSSNVKNICYLDNLKFLVDDVQEGRAIEKDIINGNRENIPDIKKFFSEPRRLGGIRNLIELVDSGRSIEKTIIEYRERELNIIKTFYETYIVDDTKKQEELVRLSGIVGDILRNKQISDDNASYINYVEQKYSVINIREVDKDDKHKGK